MAETERPPTQELSRLEGFKLASEAAIGLGEGRLGLGVHEHSQ
jgi:hypothetical protein